MGVSQNPTRPDPSQWSERQTAEQLERGEVVHFPVCPFQLPENEERQFLLEQKLASRAHKNISYDPAKDRTAGFRFVDPMQASRLHDLLSTFSSVISGWLAKKLPRYAAAWKLDQVTFRPEAE